MTADEARAALDGRYGTLGEGGLILRTGVGSTTLAFADVGRGADIDAMLADATARGRGGTWLDETIAGLPAPAGARRPSRSSSPTTTTERLRPSSAFAEPDRRSSRSMPRRSRTTTGLRHGPRHRRQPDRRAAAIAAVDAAMRDPSIVAGAAVDAPVVTSPRRS